MTRHDLKKLRWLILLFLLSACSGMTKPDLPRLYQQSWEVNQPPVILIHGIMGSRLEETATGKEVWFGGLVKLTLTGNETFQDNLLHALLSLDPLN